ncbi:unnamed protein product [Urochloa decumbens]|uniref:Leucine-rich repeat-containing N-terminal plant-type domain-containing protein n=1 Tax=Urochloa decumbens TaxID=240449 RepID=A0ABC9BCW8_9POAL
MSRRISGHRCKNQSRMTATGSMTKFSYSAGGVEVDRYIFLPCPHAHRFKYDPNSPPFRPRTHGQDMAIPRRVWACAFYLLLLVCLLRRTAVQSQPMGEAELLLKIKRAWGDLPKLAAWSAAASAADAHCRWPYVGCDRATRPGVSPASSLPESMSRVLSRTPSVAFRASHTLTPHTTITGVFPSALYNCHSLEYLSLSWNHMGGELPDDIGRGLGANLSMLYLSFNKFNGTIPVSLSRLHNLRLLALDRNLFIGSIPVEIWSLKKLQWLDVSGNNLTGDIVVDGFAAMSLVMIDVSENKLTGMIPEVFGHLRNLKDLHLSNNNFSGEIPVSIGQLPSLKALSLYGNRLTGTLPSELGKHSLSLSSVFVDDNKLTGRIPEWLCAGGHLESLLASSNRLNGSIPIGLANCASLMELSLDNNQLSGEVPKALWTSGKHVFVHLRNNTLTGSLPAMLSNNLHELDIGNNQFIGTIPAVALGLLYFIADNNQFSGEIPPHIDYGMPLLQHLNLANNKLYGNIG